MDQLNARLLAALLAQQGGGGAAAALGGGGGGGGGGNDHAAREAKRLQVEAQMRNSPNELFRIILKWQLETTRFENTARVDTIKNLLDDEYIKRDLNIVDDNGYSALYYAVQTRQHKAARLLVEAGADPFGDNEAHSPLRLIFCGTKGALGSTTLQFARWLMGYLEGVGKKQEMLHCLTQPPCMLLFICSKKKLQLSTAQALLQHGVDPMITDAGGWTALHHACKRGHVSLARMLLDHGADINAVKNDGYTPLHLAALNNNCEVVMLLMERGAMTEALTGDNEERPVLGRKSAADLADINNHQYAAYLIRNWAFWHTHSPKPAVDNDTNASDMLIA